MIAEDSNYVSQKMKSTMVFVVGMHRSETSVLMRGLKSLGVESGSEFHNPAAELTIMKSL